MPRKYLVCPECLRKGVYKYWDGTEDIWKCRFEYLGCTWYAFADSTDKQDEQRIHDLAQHNPDKGIATLRESYKQAYARRRGSS